MHFQEFHMSTTIPSYSGRLLIGRPLYISSLQVHDVFKKKEVYYKFIKHLLTSLISLWKLHTTHYKLTSLIMMVPLTLEACWAHRAVVITLVSLRPAQCVVGGGVCRGGRGCLRGALPILSRGGEVVHFKQN